MKLLLVELILRHKIAWKILENNCKNQIKKKIRIEKVIKRKGNKLYVKWKEYIVVLIAGSIKNTFYKNDSILS